MLKLSILSLLAIAFGTVSAQSPIYGQCGGIGWSGSTTCAAGSVCTVGNPYYSQCLPGTGGGGATTTTTHPTSTATTTSHAGGTTTTSSSGSTSTSCPSGFVGTASSPNPHFTLGGKPFYFAGTNAYYLAQNPSGDIDAAFKDMAARGITVVRTWAFNEVTSASGTYYDLWSGTTQTFNTGSNGFQQLDLVLAAGAKYCIKVILSLTNNWSDYGGMDVYTKQLVSGGTHDVFYTSSVILTHFQAYVKFVVGRYASNTAVFGWELANEPRCGGSSGSPSSSCKPATLTAWMSTMSAYIQGLDANHLVGVGDEGFFNRPGSSDYSYNGGPGGDFDAYAKISSIDFLTFHMYPESWSETPTQSWGVQWITDHAAVQASSGKPAIMEEFGISDSDSTKASTYTAWYAAADSANLAGTLYWQFGDTLPSSGQTYNDGYSIYAGTAADGVAKSEAAKQAAKNT